MVSALCSSAATVLSGGGATADWLVVAGGGKEADAEVAVWPYGAGWGGVLTFWEILGLTKGECGCSGGGFGTIPLGTKIIAETPNGNKNIADIINALDKNAKVFLNIRIIDIIAIIYLPADAVCYILMMLISQLIVSIYLRLIIGVGRRE